MSYKRYTDNNITPEQYRAKKEERKRKLQQRRKRMKGVSGGIVAIIFLFSLMFIGIVLISVMDKDTTISIESLSYLNLSFFNFPASNITPGQFGENFDNGTFTFPAQLDVTGVLNANGNIHLNDICADGFFLTNNVTGNLQCVNFTNSLPTSNVTLLEEKVDANNRTLEAEINSLSISFSGIWTSHLADNRTLTDNIAAVSSRQSADNDTMTAMLGQKLNLTGGNVSGAINLATASGNVGVHTTSPRSILDINISGDTGIRFNKTAYATVRIRASSDADASDNLQYDAYTHQFVFGTNELMRISNAGLVGIGTANPSGKVTIYGNGNNTRGLLYLQSSSGNADGTMLSPTYYSFFNQDDSGSSYWNWGARYDGDANQWLRTYTSSNNSLPYMKMTTSNSFAFGAANTSNNTDVNPVFIEKVTFKLDTGNVGIGTITPNQKLQVVGNVNAYAYLTNGTDYAEIAAKVNTIENITEGMIVGSFNGKVSKNTTNTNLFFIVSGHMAGIIGGENFEDVCTVDVETGICKIGSDFTNKTHVPLAMVGKIKVWINGSANEGDIVIPNNGNGIGIAYNYEALCTSTNVSTITNIATIQTWIYNHERCDKWISRSVCKVGKLPNNSTDVRQVWCVVGK